MSDPVTIGSTTKPERASGVSVADLKDMVAAAKRLAAEGASLFRVVGWVRVDPSMKVISGCKDV